MIPITGEALRNRLENLNCEDYEELILSYLSDKLGYDFNYLKENIKVELKPADNQRLIGLDGNDNILYDILSELSQLGVEPYSRLSGKLIYTYDLLYKRPPVDDGITPEEKGMLEAINRDHIMRMNNIQIPDYSTGMIN